MREQSISFILVYLSWLLLRHSHSWKRRSRRSRRVAAGGQLHAGELHAEELPACLLAAGFLSPVITSFWLSLISVLGFNSRPVVAGPTIRARPLRHCSKSCEGPCHVARGRLVVQSCGDRWLATTVLSDVTAHLRVLSWAHCRVSPRTSSKASGLSRTQSNTCIFVSHRLP